MNSSIFRIFANPLAALTALLFTVCSSVYATTFNATTSLQPCDVNLNKRSPEGTAEFFEEARQIVLAELTGQRRAINAVFDQVRGWYLTPPQDRKLLIVSLVGMTGTGKSSVVRTLVNALNLGPKFIPFEMNKVVSGEPAQNATWGGDDRVATKVNTVTSHLQRFMAKIDIPEIEANFPQYTIPRDLVLLFDDIHDAKTLDDKGDEIDRAQLSAIWQILDGYLDLNNPVYDWLSHYIFAGGIEYCNYTYSLRMAVGEIRTRRLNNEIKQEQEEKEIEALKQLWMPRLIDYLNRQPPTLRADLGGALIFTTANVDHIYPAYSQDPEVLSPDEMHRLTGRITTSQINAGMFRFFKPEKVGRFGARWVGFETLDEFDIRTQIAKDLDAIVARHRNQIKIEFTSEFRERVYQESKRLTGGMRYLSSRIRMFAADGVGDVLYAARTHGYTHARVSIDPKDPTHSHWILTNRQGTSPLELRFQIPSEYWQATQPHAEPIRSLTALHMAAQTTVGLALLRELPVTIRSRSQVPGRNGITVFRSISELDDTTNSQQNYFREQGVARIATLLAPYAAEFGITRSNSSSLLGLNKTASDLALAMIQSLGMARGPKGEPKALAHGGLARREGLEINLDVEAVLHEGLAEAARILKREEAFVRALGQRLRTQTHVTSEELLDLMTRVPWTDSSLVEELRSGQRTPDPQFLQIQGFLDMDGGGLTAEPPAAGPPAARPAGGSSFNFDGVSPSQGSNFDPLFIGRGR